MIPLQRMATTVVGACALVSLAAGAATAAAPASGCPAGYDLKSVTVLEGQGYQVPGQVDDPTSGIRSFGSVGNDDGWVCAVRLGNQTTPWGGQVYNFWDNTLRT
jgi:hypothetical protein